MTQQTSPVSNQNAPAAAQAGFKPSRRSLLAGSVSTAVLLALGARPGDALAAKACRGQDACGHTIGGIPVAYTKAAPVNSPENHYPGFGRTTTVFPAGSSPALEPGITLLPGTKTLPVAVRLDRDVAVKVRDGATLYLDVFRPAGHEGPLPAIVVWSPYGKEGGWQSFQGYNPRAPGSGIVSPQAVSDLAKFEGPDPAYWCAKGYAIVNVDARGVNNSEGNIQVWGTQDAEDGHDVIEWVGVQPWCTGSVGMSGSSWLAITQWFIASQRPPHLRAINPREGFNDAFRDADLRGGIQNLFFNELITSHLYGNNLREDFATMGRTYPLFNAYWADKVAPVQDIDVPVFLIGSWTNSAHTMGTYTAWRSLQTERKWLRVHNTQEWVDMYTPAYEDELLQFFDRYLKGKRNGWEETPQVRLSVLDPGGADFVNIPVSGFPLKETRYERLYLDAASGKMSPQPRLIQRTARYAAGTPTGLVTFDYTFPQDAYLIGYFALRLWVELVGATNADLFVYLQKLDANGVQIPVVAPGGPTGQTPSGPVPFPNGRMRASHSDLDPALSTPYHPVPDYTRQRLFKPGEVIPVEIPITPMGILFHRGQTLRLVVEGFDPVYFGPPEVEYDTGIHVVHTGGEYDSSLLLPVIPLL